MKPIRVVSTTALFLLLGFSIPTEAGQDQQEKPQKQEQPVKPEKKAAERTSFRLTDHTSESQQPALSQSSMGKVDCMCRTQFRGTFMTNTLSARIATPSTY